MRVPPRLRRPAPWLAAAGVAVLAVVVWRARGPAEPEVYPPARILRFPVNVPAGSTYELYLDDGLWSTNAFPLRILGRPHPARGITPVSRGVWASLYIQQRGSPIDYSFLQDLGEDALQALSIHASRQRRESSPVEHIKHLSGLRFLVLLDFEIDDKDLILLRAFDQLARFDIRSSQATEGGLNRLRAALPNCTINGVKGAPKSENRRPIG